MDRIEGFAELGNTDNFSTSMLENRLLAFGVLQRAKTEDSGRITGGIFKTQKVESDDDDWD